MKLIRFTLFLLFITTAAFAQEFGLSFSYFLPKNGYFSTPISPFSIRGLGIDINKLLAVETGASLYRMTGLNMKDLPFTTRDALVGPNFTIFVPLELVIQLKSSNLEFDIKGGVFGFYGFDQRINYGNMDRAIREHTGWQVVNSDFSFKNHPGWGYHGGMELTVYVTQQVGVSLEANYLIGESKFPLRGRYLGGGPEPDVPIQTVTVGEDFQNAKIDFTGLEFSIGLIFQSGGSPPRAPQRRRR